MDVVYALRNKRSSQSFPGKCNQGCCHIHGTCQEENCYCNGRCLCSQKTRQDSLRIWWIRCPSLITQTVLFRTKTLFNLTNWEQAMSFAPIAYAPPRMGLDCQQVLDDAAGTNLKDDCDNFWVMVRGLKDFMEKDSNGFLPVTTAIPDFEADSKSYIKLKGIYKARAARDAELVKGYIEQRLESVGRPKDAIHPAAIERFVKNCRNLHVERMRALNDEYWNPE